MTGDATYAFHDDTDMTRAFSNVRVTLSDTGMIFDRDSNGLVILPLLGHFAPCHSRLP